MTRDFAKTKKEPPSARQRSGLPIFVTGFAAGAIVASLATLYHLQPARGPATASAPPPLEEPLEQPLEEPLEESTQAEGLSWDFYKMFREFEVPVTGGYGTTNGEAASGGFHWIIQAGSFRNYQDANRRRAELILLGLDAVVQENKVKGATWHRVVAGPFESELLKDRAQETLAQAQIESMPIKLR